jgi:hypothetical protein
MFFKRKGYNIKKVYAILTSEEEVSRVISTTWHFTSLCNLRFSDLI